MGYLAASRTLLAQQILANSQPKGGIGTEQEREELKSALLAAQESAVVQILLEICLPAEKEVRSIDTKCNNHRLWKCLNILRSHHANKRLPAIQNFKIICQLATTDQ